MKREASNMTPIEINGKKYYTVTQFSRLVDRAPSQISMLALRGNKIRKLKHIRIGRKPLIAAEEVEDFPFNSRKWIKKEIDAHRGEANE